MQNSNFNKSIEEMLKALKVKLANLDDQMDASELENDIDIILKEIQEQKDNGDSKYRKFIPKFLLLAKLLLGSDDASD